MKTHLPWTPAGAARCLLGGPPSTDSVRFPAPVEAAVRGREGGDEAMQIARELIRCAPKAEADAKDALALLVLASVVHVDAGSTRLPLPGIAGGFFDGLLTALGVPAQEASRVRALADEASTCRIPDAAATLLGGPDDGRPLVVQDGWLWHRRLYARERRLAGLLAARMAVQQPSADPQHGGIIEDLLSRPPRQRGRPVALSDEQQAAVRTALAQPLAVITGGPGTGKTSVVVSFLRAAVRAGVQPGSIALAAPTGKAAQRMHGAVRALLGSIADPAEADRTLLRECPEPKTLHRLLAWSPSCERFLHHEANPLAEALVIVDEGSMIDLFLMERLAGAVRPEARLVLLGDADQLPSVEAGAVFRDLLPSGNESDPRRQAGVRLTRSYRLDPSDPEGRSILLVAQRLGSDRGIEVAEPGIVREGDVTSRTAASEVLFRGVELLETVARSSEAERMRRRWLEERIRAPADFDRRVRRIYRMDGGAFRREDSPDLAALADHFATIRVLCLLRGEAGGAGAAAWNGWFHRRAAEAAGRASRADEGTPLPGEPVMMTRNDYDRELFNGDQGIVVRVSENGAPARAMAVFPRASGFAAFDPQALGGDLELAYAMTVHKAQGSEMDHALLVLPDVDTPLLTREILYTALTRARRSVTVMGAAEMLKRGAGRPLERFCGLGERLVGRIR